MYAIITSPSTVCDPQTSASLPVGAVVPATAQISAADTAANAALVNNTTSSQHQQMPVVPEKRQLEEHVHAAVGAQFWAQGVENSRRVQSSGAVRSGKTAAMQQARPLTTTAVSF